MSSNDYSEFLLSKPLITINKKSYNSVENSHSSTSKLDHLPQRQMTDLKSREDESKDVEEEYKSISTVNKPRLSINSKPDNKDQPSQADEEDNELLPHLQQYGLNSHSPFLQNQGSEEELLPKPPQTGCYIDIYCK